MYCEGLLCSVGLKDSLKNNGTFPKVCPYKKGAGRIAIRPAWTPILLFSGGLLMIKLPNLD